MKSERDSTITSLFEPRHTIRETIAYLQQFRGKSHINTDQRDALESAIAHLSAQAGEPIWYCRVCKGLGPAWYSSCTGPDRHHGENTVKEIIRTS